MSHLAGKKIILGVCGSIAAYKSAYLVRWFIKKGADVKVIMTVAAKDFITPLTLSTLSTHPVISDIADEESWNNHVELGLWADALVIAPVTATTLSKLANGNCDNMLTATYLSARCPVWVAPAMDLDMWKHPATKRNINLLVQDGVTVIPPAIGELASGLTGEGRMPEPDEIGMLVDKHFSTSQHWSGKKVLITAGPTFETIDPVRFIGNRSSGKMGIALAENLSRKGAEVTLVLGPTHLLPNCSNIRVVHVESAQEMFEAATVAFENCDLGILAAAVADFRPVTVANSKIKKTDSDLNISLAQTQDIAKYLGSVKKKEQLLVGFALETDNEHENARKKIISKNFDLIVLNSLKDKGAGFQHDTNKITILTKDNKQLHFELKDKSEVAEDIVVAIEDYFKK
ncbi:MAG TPA: bifunctional phosphopantothenoylcysteine decarboxylase/phosphopantothenate--cysteine ligase CoaBC [Saprospiraceae bacterium]|nr:bifunctional phosphopantothenoylcysteine decarboxylase/phosphopantothenate--cysteine ligase CoaBC [Saprospiraceae bacterium]HMV23518.1 bifunctional phosphopantothenoylcysteine decarboxylase/phosphopantothenate--cysteine ligase CoaBC [Saprospiraceae bacterium]HMX81694.1 bifunctional phosphopantothenoylcysteine decarboxylase/phosphopantothenate--cysteine ligase CoaBC [Saprospiraceae bacterium]HMX84405.1 bifunctional phosphopantothenoylcysteine decarboxylase/phosphopantothenate--cysteine ligase 